MITKNFKLLMNKKLFNNTNYYAFQGINGSVAGGTSANNVFSSNNYNKISVGSGDTLPSIDDYSLENKITDLTLVSRTMEPNAPEYQQANKIVTYTATYQNNTSNPITINELGIESGEGYTGSGWGGIVLLCREVLEEPLVIEPNEAYTISITIG